LDKTTPFLALVKSIYYLLKFSAEDLLINSTY
jgi:hypothetical protein